MSASPLSHRGICLKPTKALITLAVEAYAARHLIENFFANEKIARNFLAAVQLVASVVWLN